MSLRRLVYACFALLQLLPAIVQAELPAAVPAPEFPVRYVSLGDSLAAGFKAQPATQGFAYQLYLRQVFGSIPKTAFANIAIQGATSMEVLKYQLPQVQLLQPKAVTLSVGGNDLLRILGSDNPPAMVETVFNDYSLTS
jgi:lysophospholipase L1-like esterase